MRELLPKAPFRIRYDAANASANLAFHLAEKLESTPAHVPLVLLCIGTDRSTGDALGPLIGSKVAAHDEGMHVFGTLEHPVHAVNLSETIHLIESQFADPYIIAVDACLGQAANIGQITMADGALRPGAGVHKTLPAVGNLHITGIVNVGGFMEYFVLQNTRLAVVYKMAQIIAEGVHLALLENRACTKNNIAASRNDGRIRNGWWRIK